MGTWSTLSLTGSSLESRAPSTCANPWAPAGLSRSSPARSASKAWSGLRLTWKTPSSRLRLLSPGAALVLPREAAVHPGHPAPLHPDARYGHGEVHGADGHLQQPVRRLQPGLDHPPTSHRGSSPNPPSPHTSKNVKPPMISF